jgi:hypothetical protein
MVTFTKLKSGDWGLKSYRELVEGFTIQVTTKAGGQRDARVGRRIWSDGVVWLYAIDRGDGDGAPSKAGRKASRKVSRASLEEEADFLEDQGHYSAADKFRRDHGLWG